MPDDSSAPADHPIADDGGEVVRRREEETIAVTGATGYVGGRLVRVLLDLGYRVRCIVREPRKLEARPWREHPRLEVVRDDVSDVEHLARSLDGCRAAYYLIHSMEVSGAEYARRDRELADRFARGAGAAGVGRIIYLGGLGEMGDGLSEHLRSRREVERVLAQAGVPVTVFRAAMIIGSGSASFEILRYLVERLPVMVTPRWVATESQPIAITDVLYWLSRCLEVPETTGRTLEIGGADVLEYRELMRITAAELGLPRRLIIPLPVLTPRLSSGWISLVTPVGYRIARPLAEGLRNRVVVNDPAVQSLMPHRPMGVAEAIRKALQRVRSNEVETRWSVAGAVPGDPDWAGGTVFTDRRSIEIDAGAAPVFRAVCRVGGGHGWYAGDILWRIRGLMDQAVGGPGLRRGRRHPDEVEFGETLDFWRVVRMERDRALELRAEMKLPGEATLGFELEPRTSGREATRLVMTARFRPRGFLGILYWYAVLPLHAFVFGGMLRGIERTAEREAIEARSTPPDGGEPARGEPAVATDDAPASRYGRARLRLGITTVGTMVVLAALGLALGLPDHVARRLERSDGTPGPLAGEVLGVLAFVAAYALLHVPFDLLGGWGLPRRHRRAHPPLPRYLAGLARGATAHAAVLGVAGLALLLGGRVAGPVGAGAAGVLVMVGLLLARGMLARIVAPLARVRASDAPDVADEAGFAVRFVASEDEGFTGGILGAWRPRACLLPAHWRERLGETGLRIAARRRGLAVRSGAWRRGRLVAVGFTVVGLALAVSAAGPERAGTAAGVIEASLVFTIWSFLGLLVLPTLSRAGVAEVDERLGAVSTDLERADLEDTVRELDAMQDAETERPGLVEAVFHPIPSVRRRLQGPRTHGIHGGWDAARSAVFLSAAGLGLLGRAVHCNCGRPALWVFLPAD